MCPHIHTPPVDDPGRVLGCRYVSCLQCNLEWPIRETPICCPECCEPVQFGRVRAALQRVYKGNGF